MGLLYRGWRQVDRRLIALSVLLLNAYRVVLGPLFAGACRFHPSCSRYAEEAVTRHGIIRGGWLTLMRLCRCHPFHAGGIDPVPPAGGPERPAGSRAPKPSDPEAVGP